MKKQPRSKRAAAIIMAVIMAVFFLIGCTQRVEIPAEAFTVYETNSLKIVRQGAKTDVYDLAGNAHYGFTKKKVRKDPDAPKIREAKTGADTDTIKIQIFGGWILVEDKTAGKTIFIP